MRKKTGVSMLSIWGLAFGLAACDPRSSQSGEENELKFSYQTTDSSRDFSRPIAEGASLFVRVEGAEDEEVSSIISAGSTSPDVLQVRQSAERSDELVVTGQRAGSSTLSVEARLNGDVREDRITFEVARATQAALSHQCTTERDAAYLEGLPVQLDFERYDSRRRRLVGQGACGVSFEPVGMIERISCDEASIRLNGDTQPGPLQMTTGLGAPSNKRQSLGIQVVSFSKLDFAPIQDQLMEGDSEVIVLRPQTEDWTICSHLDFQAEILTPSTCTFSDGFDDRATFTSEDANQIRLRGEAPGECVFHVTLPIYGVIDVWEFSIPVFAREER